MDLCITVPQHHNDDQNNSSKNSDATAYNQSYVLNLKKSLKKKLDCTNRNEITYNFTKGGITIQLDPISFELFIHACDQYYKNPVTKLDSFNKTTMKDRIGNETQHIFRVFDSPSLGYTINAYLTKCSLLINGGNTNMLLERDLQQLQHIMDNTKINNSCIDIHILNKKLAHTLKQALQTWPVPNHVTDDRETPSNVSTTVGTEEKCYVCKCNCKTRAVQCINGHWVHYRCERLSEEDISKLEKGDYPYSCRSCNKENEVYTLECNASPQTVQKLDIQNTDLSTISKQLHIRNNVLAIEQHVLEDNVISNDHISIAESLLREETGKNCPSCNFILDDECTCMVCNDAFHSKCIDKNTETCYGCIGANHQLSLNISKEKPEKSHDNTTETLTNVDDKSKEHLYNNPTNVKSSISSSKANKNNQTANEPDSNKQETVIPKEIRQIEQKLKKKEEQLKIKEAILNENATEKTTLLDRILKAESKNIELEHTIRTLNQAIDSKIKMKEENSSDDIVVGIRDRVTKYVLTKVDQELSQLLGMDKNKKLTSSAADYNPLGNGPNIQQSYGNHHLSHDRSSGDNSYNSQNHRPYMNQTYHHIDDSTQDTHGRQGSDGGLYHNVSSVRPTSNFSYNSHYQDLGTQLHQPYYQNDYYNQYMYRHQGSDGGPYHNVSPDHPTRNYNYSSHYQDFGTNQPYHRNDYINQSVYRHQGSDGGPYHNVFPDCPTSDKCHSSQDEQIYTYQPHTYDQYSTPQEPRNCAGPSNQNAYRHQGSDGGSNHNVSPDCSMSNSHNRQNDVQHGYHQTNYSMYASRKCAVLSNLIEIIPAQDPNNHLCYPSSNQSADIRNKCVSEKRIKPVYNDDVYQYLEQYHDDRQGQPLFYTQKEQQQHFLVQKSLIPERHKIV
ncbi:unnamed protein product [Mytilus edulis]|uniref:Phorbol-ester/DAG-type domain-containing protein n=1 Tax=Mytilus edulis TaxID=6550 RepID=A0A8S3UEL0_MYTED|nr:unnamed protein product [Mytilus edulis]